MMKEDSKPPEEGAGFKVIDKRFWARGESGLKKEGERSPRKSDYPTVVEQLQARMEASREKLKQRLEEVEDEKAAFRRRIAAEMERRLDNEKLELIKVMLEVLDHLDAAIGSAAKGKNDKHLLKGVKAIRKDLWARLRKLKVSKIETVGKPFEPELHEAVMTRSAEKSRDGVVLEEVRAGYLAGETLIRPAQVVVGSSG